MGSPPSSTDARMVRTRAALSSALLSLLEVKAFDQVTVREITKTADVGYATFFRHYPDKEALLNDLAAHQIRELLGMVLPIFLATDGRAACLALCAYVGERRKLWSALLTGGAASTVREEFIRQAKLIPANEISPDSWLPTELRVVYATGGVLDILAWWLQQPEPLPEARIAEFLDRLVISPTIAAP